MREARSWVERKAWIAGLLERRTGKDLASWTAQIRDLDPPNVLDTLLDVAEDLGEVTIQTRKGYVTLVAPRRTFASIEPTTRSRVDLGHRLENQASTDSRRRRASARAR